jgi:hypothetical protein
MNFSFDGSTRPIGKRIAAFELHEPAQISIFAVA